MPRIAGLVALAGVSFAAVLRLVAPTPLETAADAAAPPHAPAAFQMASLGPALPPHAGTAKPVPPETVLYLIRSTLLALENANRTGNYSVLRDLATAQFQSRNSAADLARIFADLRRRGLDLTPAAVNVPRLAGTGIPQTHDPAGPAHLRLNGSLNAGRQAVDFDLVFLAVDSQWRLDGLSIHAPQATADNGQPR